MTKEKLFKIGDAVMINPYLDNDKRYDVINTDGRIVTSWTMRGNNGTFKRGEKLRVDTYISGYPDVIQIHRDRPYLLQQWLIPYEEA
jgi:glycerophosphoryl diester phosphodiesterase